ncbi:MAG: ribosome silencing factor, partial [Actinobacteria bacterium 13_2_20CM_2_66_6]
MQLARLLRSAATEKKAWDPVVIDVREQTSIADYFVICEGETDRQVRAIADAMMEAAKTRDRRPLAVDGY